MWVCVELVRTIPKIDTAAQNVTAQVHSMPRSCLGHAVESDNGGGGRLSLGIHMLGLSRSWMNTFFKFTLYAQSVHAQDNCPCGLPDCSHNLLNHSC